MKTMMIAFFAAALSAGPLGAETPAEKGLAIAREADRRDEGFGDSRVEMVMTLKNRHGQKSVRHLRSRTLEVDGDGDKSLIIFDRPADVKNTAFLSWTHKKGPDDQWLYLPALKRVKRISSRNKSGPFMGSEFAFEDFASEEVEKYTYRYIKKEKMEGLESFVVERIPVDRKSGYTKQIVWYDVEHYRPHKMEYYDRKSELLKTLTAKDFKQYLKKFWRPGIMSMVNHQTGKSTDIEFKDYAFKTGLTKRDFDRNSLKRAR